MPDGVRSVARRLSFTATPTGKGLKHLRSTIATLDPQLQAFIGEQLRRYYADLLTEPIPDRLSELLDQIADAKEHMQ